jgi:hypothetical protein
VLKFIVRHVDSQGTKLGKCGDDIDDFTFTFVKPISHSSLFNVKYPNLDNNHSGLSPDVLESFSFCNNNGAKITKSVTFEQTTARVLVIFDTYSSKGEKECWTDSTTHAFEIGLEVKASALEIVEMGGSFKWTTTYSVSPANFFVYCNILYSRRTNVAPIRPENRRIQSKLKW